MRLPTFYRIVSKKVNITVISTTLGGEPSETSSSKITERSELYEVKSRAKQFFNLLKIS